MNDSEFQDAYCVMGCVRDLCNESQKALDNCKGDEDREVLSQFIDKVTDYISMLERFL